MADLAKTQTPVTATRRLSDNTDFTLPARRNTEGPNIEVNAPIVGPNRSKAQALAEILGVARDTAETAAGLLTDAQDRRTKKDAAAGLLAGQSGAEMDKALAKRRAYSDAYYLAGAQRSGFEVAANLTNKINERLADEDNPATLDDINQLIDHEFASVALDEHGQARDLGSPQAAAAMAQIFSETRAKLLGPAAEAIKTRQDSKVIDNQAFVAVQQGLPLASGSAKAGITPVDPDTGKAIPGLLQPGNIDLHHRPVVHNKDGSISTVRSISIEQDGKTYLIPTVVDGRVVSDDAAVAEFRKTGQHLGVFADEVSATAYAVNLHEQQASEYVKPGKGVLAVTGRMPIRGNTTSSFTAHRARGSAGLDLAAPSGTPVELPASGTVIQVGRDARSGNFVRVDHGNGVISSYAHLSKADVREGQVLTAGATVGAVGQTGHATGPHLHYRIKVGGKDVDPATYKYTGEGSPALPENPDLKPVVGAPAQELRPRYDFENGFMAKIPKTIDRGTAKKAGITALINYADQYGKPEILEGIWDSTKADGSPSFTPAEISDIRDAADKIRTKQRIEGDRLKKQKWDDNADVLLKEFIDGRTVSRATIRDWTNNGSLDPNFGYSLIEHLDAEDKEAEREAKADAKQAEYDANSAIDVQVGGMIAERQAGNLKGASPEEDLQRFRNGEFGTGKRAAGRYRQARAAAAAGQKVLEQEPEAAQWGAYIGDQYKVAKPGTSMIDRAMSKAVSPETHAAAMARYKQLIGQGEAPSIAADKVLKEYPIAANTGGILRTNLQARKAALEGKK